MSGTRRRIAGTALVLAVIAAAAAGLSACSSSAANAPPCPRVSIPTDASAITRFQGGDASDPKNMTLHAEITSYQGACSYDPKAKMMKVSVAVGIDATRGPAGSSARRDVVAYFVAMPGFYPAPQAKKLLNVGLVFPPDRDTVHVHDHPVDISFPISNFDDLTPYQIYIGIQLNQPELDYNRQHPSGSNIAPDARAILGGSGAPASSGSAPPAGASPPGALPPDALPSVSPSSIGP